MITRIHITQIANGKMKVSVIYNESGVRISRHEVLYASANPSEVASAISRLKIKVAENLATIQEMDS